MKILVCTIIRNQQHNILNWYNQLKQIVESNPSIDFFISVYENNSIDGTKEILNNLDFNFFKKNSIVSQDLENIEFFKGGYEPYGEESKRRVKILSDCRNKSLFVDFLDDSDFVLFVEPDIQYEPSIFTDILNFSINNNYDVLSAISFSHGEHYDKWGTRINPNDTWSNLTNRVGSNEVIDVHSTFNCFVLYKSMAFTKDKCEFGFMSDYLGTHDCDTVVVCNNLRKKGYNKIGILANKVVSHFF
jgi:hypothetical protein